MVLTAFEAVVLAFGVTGDGDFACWWVCESLLKDFCEAAAVVGSVEYGEDVGGDSEYVVGLVQVGGRYCVRCCCAIAEGTVADGDGFEIYR